MKLKNTLSPEEYKSIKESYFHIYHYFLDRTPLDKAHITCLFKWGIQLNVSEEEILYIDDKKNIKFMKKTDRLEHLYNLVFMIFLDGVVEDGYYGSIYATDFGRLVPGISVQTVPDYTV
jgi:hypothetical protein